MKLLPLAVTISCAAMLVSCGHKTAPDTQVQQDQQAIEDHQAREERVLHEREAALDEQQRLLDQEKQQLAQAAPMPPPAEMQQPAASAAQPQPQPESQPQTGGQGVPQPENEAPGTDISYQTFYNDLGSSGWWAQVPGYGYAWQPYEAQQDPHWRPYLRGHWIFTDRGWNWVSTEPYGWIVYHYGRWMRTQNLKWAWVPGNQWAPAWVSWRFGNNYVGWAALPPEAQFNPASGIGQWADQQYGLGAQDYIFIPAEDFGYGGQAEALMEAEGANATAIYADSNNITNISYNTQTQAIVCNGPNYDFIRSKSRAPLPPPVKIKPVGYRKNGNEPVISANTIEVAAPAINRSPSAPKSIRAIVTDRRIISAATPAPGISQIVPIQPLPQAPSAAIVNQMPNAAPYQQSRNVEQPAAQQPREQYPQAQVPQLRPQEDRVSQQQQQQQQQRQEQQQADIERARQEQERQQAVIERAREQQQQQAAAMRQQEEAARAAQVQAARAVQESAARQSQSGGAAAAASPTR